MALPTLILLGTVHGDPKGFSRTRLFLERHRPDLILVEISDFSLKFRRENSFRLRKAFVGRVRMATRDLNIEFGMALKHAQIASILRQIALPFEYRASAAYSKKTGTHLEPVDYSDFSREWIETWQEMISVENIRRLLDLESAGAPVSSQYAQAERIIRGTGLPPEFAPGREIGWQEREERMARQISSTLERFNPARPVYIGGWWHLCCGGRVKTIRELLGVEAGSCRLLNFES